MKAFIKYLGIQFKMDLRNKGVLMTYYLVPLLFFVVVGLVFSSVNPEMKPTLAATMSIFAVTMGAVMGTPMPIVRARESGTLRAFRVNGIPDAAVLSVHALSAFLHLLIVCIIIYFVSPPLLKSSTPENPALYAAVMLLYLITTISIALLIGSIARSQSVSTMLSMIVFFPTVMLSGIMFPAAMLTRAFRWFGMTLPATYAVQAIKEAAFGLKSDFSPVLALCLLAGMGLAALIIAVWRFSGISQSGQN